MHKIILTFDLEYWYESLSLQKYLTGRETELLAQFADRLLGLLKRNSSQATFFVTDKVLTQEPEIIRQIHTAGHEIAVHSIDHKPLWDKTREQFDQELKLMTKKIEDLVGKKPIGHRAVNFSLNHETKWSLGVLVANGIRYDSSVFPFTFSPVLLTMFRDELYGVKSKLLKPYKINFEQINKEDSNSPLIEFPIAVWKFWKIKYPLTGGIYIRMTPFFVFKALLKNALRQRDLCVHFHSFDFLGRAPDVKMPAYKKLIKFYNTKNTFKKLEYILKTFECISVEEYLKKKI